MKKFLFLSFVLVVFVISCGGDDPTVTTAVPEPPVIEAGDDAEIIDVLSANYGDKATLDTQWAGDKSTLVTDFSVLSNKVLLGSYGNNAVPGPANQGQFIALFITPSQNVGYAVADTGQAAIDAATAFDGTFYTSWDPRKIVYTDGDRVKISWLGRSAGNADGGGFIPANDFDDLGTSENAKNIGSVATYSVIPFTPDGQSDTSKIPVRPDENVKFLGGGSISSFVYEGRQGSTAENEPVEGNPNGGISPQRRAWAWTGTADVQGTIGNNKRYEFVVVPNATTLFGYAPNTADGDNGQSDVAYPFTSGDPAGSIILSTDSGSAGRENNSGPLGKQVIFRGTDNRNILDSAKRINMLTTVVADSVRIKTEGDNQVVLLEFPAFSGLDAIFDGYNNGLDFPGYKNLFESFSAANPPAIDTTFGDGKADGPTYLDGQTYETMKVPFLLLSAEAN